jgi:DNA-binding LytR/AlgR family response regulator
MVALRKLVYWFNDSYYDFGDVFEQFLYEYLKDAPAYGIFLVLIYLYRHIVLRLQGEASLLAMPEHSDQQQEEYEPQRILVKKLGREFLVRIDEIERIEASGNYVNLHIANRVYPLRETLTKMEQCLDNTKFKRIHRSHMINLDQVEEIRPFESGDAQILLSNGVTVPMSRTYRHQFVDNYW